MARKEASREALADAYAQLFASAIGMPASTGRIFAALLLSSTPLSQAQLRTTLSLSDGSVSEGLQLLVANRLVQRAGNARARPAHFEVHPDSWKHASESTLANVRATYAIAELTVRHLEDNGVEGDSLGWAHSLQAMYAVLVEELAAVIQRGIEAGERPPVRRRRKAV